MEVQRYSGVNVICLRKKGNVEILEIMEVQVKLYRGAGSNCPNVIMKLLY